MPAIIYLGIDPGFADAGFGVISVEGGKERSLAYGSLKTPAGMPTPKRLKLLADGLNRLIDEHQPAKAAIEKLFFSKNVKTALAVAEARGVIRLVMETRGLPCAEFSPAEVKIAVGGQGDASKEQVQKMVKTLLGLTAVPEPDDAADALALAITLANTKRFRA